MASLAAAVRIAASGLREADDSLKSRGGPSGGLRPAAAYLTGVVIIRVVANSYLFFSTLRRIVSADDAYGMAILSTAAACVPLSAAICLSRRSPEADRRLAFLPCSKATRLAIAAIEPSITAAPIILLASILPIIAALPLAAGSIREFIKVAALSPFVVAALSLGIRSWAGAVARLAVPRPAAAWGHRKSIAMTVVLLALTAANPSYIIANGRASVSLFGTRAFTASSAWILTTKSISLLTLAGLATGAIAFSLLSALAADAMRRGKSGQRGPLTRYFTRGFPWARIPIPPMAAVVDRKGSFMGSVAFSIAFAALSLFQGATPAIPLAVGAASFLIRVGSATAFLATENATTRRLGFIAARSGSAERAYLASATALAGAVALPLALAGIALS